MLTALDVTALTDFALAAETFFLSGLLFARPKTRYSAAWFWQWALLMLAVSAFIGGVDHGFIQPAGETAVRKAVQHTTWVVVGLVTAAAFLTMSKQFAADRWQRVLAGIAAVQFVVYLGAIFVVDTYAVVVANYALVMIGAIWALAANARRARHGAARWPIVAGIGAAMIASIAQAAGWRVSATFDRQSVYHVGMMVAVACLYLGGLRLKGFARQV